MLICDQTVSFDDFKMLDSSENEVPFENERKSVSIA